MVFARRRYIAGAYLGRLADYLADESIRKEGLLHVCVGA